MLFVKNEEILARVDHTALKATATWQEIRTLCEEALEYHTASVCIPPSYVARAHAEFPGLNICTVIGFPLGYNTTACKVFETQQAVREGASEVDMVVNLGDVKNGDFDAVEKEIEALKKAAGDNVLKVIVENPPVRVRDKGRGRLYQNVHRVWHSGRYAGGHCPVPRPHWPAGESEGGRRHPHKGRP